MLEPGETTEDGEREQEGELAKGSPYAVGSSATEPPGGSRDSGRLGEERADMSRSDVQQDVTDTGTQAEAVLETAEEAQYNTPIDAEEHDEKSNVKNSTATVKILLVPGGHVMTMAFAIGLSVEEVKHHLASELKVPLEVLQLSLNGRVVEEQQSLMELGIRPHSSTQMEMTSSDPSSYPLRLLRLPEHDSMPDVITVRVQKEEGVFKEMVVEIERSQLPKPFLGGYRHRLTGVEYHHAANQTLLKKRPDKGVLVYSRSTQTVELKSKLQQCSVNMSTQMTGIGCYTSCMNDKLVTPGKYITAEEYHSKRLKAVICLQSYARRWLAQEAVEQLRKERTRRLAWFEMQDRKCKEEKEEQLRHRRKRWLNPQSREDFNLLYHALEKWRIEEEQQINSTLRGAERKAALCSLLDQETQLIAAIGRHHINVEANNYDKIIRNFLNKCAAPHQWRTSSGRLLEMDTVHDVRARELKELYNEISVYTVDKQQRLSYLKKLKKTVEEHECQLVWDIIDLIDREMDLMSREVKEHNLEGLRKRICTLFLQYIKTPAFNPKVVKLLKVHKKPSQLKHNMFFCHGCQRYLCSANFDSSANGCRSRWCRYCTRLDNIARSRDEDSLYKSILRRLRTEEHRLKTEATIPFLLQVEDIRYLIEKVWASCSALNGSRDLYNMVFTRWERQKDWSPWNCILLSKEETSAHTQVEDIHEAYETTFIQWVEQKHSMARQHFSKNPIMAKHLSF
ncbi:IQ and ubiquitin-like domain-containing protein isoform X1 [Fundulus heteroclitus]|uniref:IQ and ubiquitin-like domain-containing protein isoform X1 n=2 Tax=Fundulus heteroclitus TaxID=8078 RepID=UPI00165BCBBA|nr:IQ and ubiquitin-like domain-containing protein isoform X1 [Fundulus heteroclitus]